MNQKPPPKLLMLIGPGILVAATGVGAGDLATAAFTGSKLGIAILWLVVLGAFLKFVLNEGLARWQLVTGETLLEGTIRRLGQVAAWFFLIYLVIWTVYVGSALMSACGVTMHAILPLMDATSDKRLYGILHSAIAVGLVLWGGFPLFEKVMSVCIGIMFITVIATAIVVKPDWGSMLSGLFVPRIPDFHGQGLGWSIALMGGVGGTVTVLCYGYWIREAGRIGVEEIRNSRIDLATGYVMTALFGIAMVIIGSTVTLEKGSSSKLIVVLADSLETNLGSMGPTARWIFLIGAWGAVASSLLGVWQSVPYLFADFWRIWRRGRELPAGTPVNRRSREYLLFLAFIATVPAIGLFANFQEVQKIYAIVGACFMPLLALVLLLLNSRSSQIGKDYRNSLATTLLLLLTLGVFVWVGTLEILNLGG